MALVFLISNESGAFPCAILKSSLVAAFQIFYQVPDYVSSFLFAILGIESRASWMLGILPQDYIPSLRPPFVCVCGGGGGVILLPIHVEAREEQHLLYHCPLHLLRRTLTGPETFSQAGWPVNFWIAALQQWGDGVMGMCSHARFLCECYGFELGYSCFHGKCLLPGHLYRPLSFGDRISWTLDWPRTCFVAKDDLELQILISSSHDYIEVCTTTLPTEPHPRLFLDSSSGMYSGWGFYW